MLLFRNVTVQASSASRLERTSSDSGRTFRAYWKIRELYYTDREMYRAVFPWHSSPKTHFSQERPKRTFRRRNLILLIPISFHFFSPFRHKTFSSGKKKEKNLEITCIVTKAGLYYVRVRTSFQSPWYFWPRLIFSIPALCIIIMSPSYTTMQSV